MDTPLGTGGMVEVWLDHPIVGCGYRRFAVVSVGRKWVTLLYCPSVTTIDLDIAELSRNRSLKTVEPNPRILKRLLRHAISERKRLGLRSSTVAAKAFLATLESRE